MSKINSPEIKWIIEGEDIKSYIDNFDKEKEINEFDKILSEYKMKDYYKKINKEEITLTLKKRGNLLNGIICYEQIDKSKLNKLMDSDLLRKDFRYESIGKIYDSEKDLLIKLLRLTRNKYIIKKMSINSRNWANQNNKSQFLVKFFNCEALF